VSYQKETAIRELREEVGFEVSEVVELGRPVWGSERLYFFAVDVSGLERYTPSEDGSPVERYGECILVPYNEALQVGDMKTDLGIMRLCNLINNVERTRTDGSLFGGILCLLKALQKKLLKS
jgi:8-oxo-dGTP pyrophosphatase MutT (NUDIX family)